MLHATGGPASLVPRPAARCSQHLAALSRRSESGLCVTCLSSCGACAGRKRRSKDEVRIETVICRVCPRRCPVCGDCLCLCVCSVRSILMRPRQPCVQSRPFYDVHDTSESRIPSTITRVVVARLVLEEFAWQPRSVPAPAPHATPLTSPAGPRRGARRARPFRWRCPARFHAP